MLGLEDGKFLSMGLGFLGSNSFCPLTRYSVKSVPEDWVDIAVEKLKVDVV